ncbi:MAG: SBBP repeat-containing protein, partial [Thermocrinis sp.]|nr:SBBP repeat-containing protein [Thermocrinis sp.]
LFYIKPGADPSKIVVEVDGAEGLKLSKDGEIIIQTGLGDLKLSKPIAWQEKDGKKLPVEVSYKLIGKNRYSFEVAKADPSLPVVIDPILQSTYLGGNDIDGAKALAIHPTTGEVYVAGYTHSTDFPGTTGGAQPNNAGGYAKPVDAFVARLNKDLTQILQATYLGGSNDDEAYTLTIHPTTGDVYVAGYTFSNDFPNTSGGAQASCNNCGPSFYDAFVARLSADLRTLHQSTYLGGTNYDFATALAISSTGDVYVAGITWSTDFPGTIGGAQAGNRGYYDAFVARLSADLRTLHQSTYLGGSDGDYPTALAISSTGDVYVAGYTSSTDFPGTSGGAQASYGGGSDAFVARLSADLTQILKSTYLGGSGDDIANALAISSTGDVYVAGLTSSTDFPGTSGGAQASYGGGSDAFVARLSADLTQILKSTYLGGSGDDIANALAISPTGDVYVAGFTNSFTDFPGTTGGAQETYGGGEGDAFVAKLNSDLTQILQSTYLGGSYYDEATALAISSTGDVYVAGLTYSTDFPGTTGGAQVSCSSCNDYYPDAFVAKLSINLTAGPILSISPTPTNGTITSNPSGISCGSGGSMCSADFYGTVTLTATPDPGYDFVRWEGACSVCGNSNPCTITISGNVTCTAIFAPRGSGSGSGSGSGGSGTGLGSGGTCGGGGGCSMTGSASSMAGVWNILVWLSVPAFVVARRIRRK